MAQAQESAMRFAQDSKAIALLRVATKNKLDFMNTPL
jgi:hypothetical protein